MSTKASIERYTFVTDQPPRKNRHLWAILLVILEKKCSWTRCPLRFFLKNNYQPLLKAVGFRTFKAGSELLLFLNNNNQPPLKAAGFRIFKVGGDLRITRIIFFIQFIDY